MIRQSAQLMAVVALLAASPTGAQPAPTQPLSTTAPPEPPAETAQLLTAADDQLWVVRTNPHGKFKLFRLTDGADGPGLLTVAEMKGRPVAAAVNGRRLYLAYDDGTVHQIEQEDEPGAGVDDAPKVRRLAPLPVDMRLAAWTATRAGPVALVDLPASVSSQMICLAGETAATDDGSDAVADATATTEGDAADAAEAKSSEALSPGLHLLRFRRGVWQATPLPPDAQDAGPFLLAGHSDEDAVTCVYAAATGSAPMAIRRLDGEGWSDARPVELDLLAKADVVRVRDQTVVLDASHEAPRQVRLHLWRPGKTHALGRFAVPSPYRAAWHAVTHRGRLWLMLSNLDGQVARVPLGLEGADLALAEVEPMPVVERPPIDFDPNTVGLLLAVLLASLVLLILWQRDPRTAVVTLPADMAPAMVSRRIIAACIDMVLPLAAGMIAFGVVDPMLALQNWPGITTDFQAMGPALIAITLFMLHTTLDEALTGRTLGKRMMHCRVVSVDGSKPNVSQVVSRALLKLVKLIAPLMLLLLFVLPLLNPYSQRLGDILGRTVVISEPPAGAETGSNSEGEEPDEQEPSD